MLCVATMLSVMQLSARDFTYTYEGNTFRCTTLDEEAKTCEIGQYYGSEISGALIIPSKVFDNEDEFTVTTIRQYGFSSCSGLTSVEFPNSLTEIKNGAFGGCSGLSGTLKIGDSVTEIGGSAFAGCNNITDIDFGTSPLNVRIAAFGECTGLQKINIPTNVILMENQVFRNCTNLKEVYIEDCTEPFEVGSSAFFQCPLESLYIGRQTFTSGDHQIGNTFSNIKTLKNVKFSNNVTSIENNMFSGCSGLYGTLTLPSSLQSLGNTPFSYCNFTEIYSLNPVPPIQTGQYGVFTNENYKATLYVPAESVDDYKNSDVWKGFFDIKPIGTEETSIPGSVDLGLSINWSSFNWGATTPWDYGKLYGWGAPSSASIRDENYPTQANIAGTEYDIITRDWGHGYRMPSTEELRELKEKCTWSFTTIHDVNGYKVTGPNGKSIFIPAAGIMHYPNIEQRGSAAFIWSAEQFSSNCADALHHTGAPNPFIYFTYKYDGISLRGVTAENISGTEFDIDGEENSGIEQITAEDEGSISVYSIHGILLLQNCSSKDLNNLPSGMYIIKNGNKVTKVII